MNPTQIPDNDVARLKEENNTLLKNFLRTQNILENVTESRDTMIEDRNLLDNEVARLRELLTEFYDTLDIGGYHHSLCNIQAEDPEKWDLGCNCEIADLKKKYIELMSTAPAPEEPVTQEYDSLLSRPSVISLKKRNPVAPAPEETTIKESLTTEPVTERIESLAEDVLKLHKPDTEHAPEWRELGPDEVICEGDEEEYTDAWGEKMWLKVVDCKRAGTNTRLRTRRPLPKREERPLEDEIKRIETRDAWIDPTKDVITCLRYLRDEIAKLKEAR